MGQVVCRFPVIETFVAVLYWGKQSSYNIRDEEDVECLDWFDRELGGSPRVENELVTWTGRIEQEILTSSWRG
jgi:hypothetical protein